MKTPLCDRTVSTRPVVDLKPTPARLRALNGIASRLESWPCGSSEHRLWETLRAAGLTRYKASGSALGWEVTEAGKAWLKRHGW